MRRKEGKEKKRGSRNEKENNRTTQGVAPALVLTSKASAHFKRSSWPIVVEGGWRPRRKGTGGQWVGEGNGVLTNHTPTPVASRGEMSASQGGERKGGEGEKGETADADPKVKSARDTPRAEGEEKRRVEKRGEGEVKSAALFSGFRLSQLTEKKGEWGKIRGKKGG